MMYAPIIEIVSKNSTFFRAKDGMIYGCGDNRFGQLGLGSTGSVFVPIPIPITNVKKIALGEYHTIFVLQDGSCKACGNNLYGQLGIGYKSNYEANIIDCHVGDIIDACCIGPYTIFKQQGGVLLVAGSTEVGIVRDSPVPMEDMHNIFKGNQDLLVRISESGYDLFGESPYGSIENDNAKYTKIAAGGEHLVFLHESGSVYSCGNNDYHQLGYDTPTSFFGNVCIISNLSNIKDVCCGYEHSLFLDEDKNIYICGSNRFGQAGYNDEILEVPKKIATDIIYMTAGSFNTFFVKKDGSIYTSGYNREGQLGLGQDVGSVVTNFMRIQTFDFDTSLTENDITVHDTDVTYACGGIGHTITVIHSNEGGGTTKSKCIISSPDDNKYQLPLMFTNTFTTDNVHTLDTVLKSNEDTLIRQAKQYIDDNTHFHREAVKKKYTRITFSNGEHVDFEGELTEEEAIKKATEYINTKYRIDTSMQYYRERDFDNTKVYIEGETVWKPSKGAVSLVLQEKVSYHENY